MKKLITATILVAFAGAVAFASLQGTTANSKDVTSKEKKEKKEVKKTEKKKVKKHHACPFS